MANTNWENLPSTNTPINSTNLNKISNGLVNVSTEVDNTYRVNFLHSKNLFSNNPVYYNNSTSSDISNGVRITAIANYTSFVLFKMIDVSNLVGEKISVKANFTTGGKYIIGLCDASGGNRIVGQQTSTSGDTIIYTIPTITTSKYLALWLYAPSTANAYVDYTNIMVNMGDTSLDYEAYITPSIVVDNDIIYEEPVLLWQNSSPTSEFANQTVNLNENANKYKFIEIYYKARNDINEWVYTKFPVGTYGWCNGLSAAGTSFRAYNRQANNETDTSKISFGACNFVNTLLSERTTNNAYLIPVYVYGIK